MTLKPLLKLPETRLSDKHISVFVCVKEIKIAKVMLWKVFSKGFHQKEG